MDKKSWTRLAVFVLIALGVYSVYQELFHFRYPQFWEPKLETIAVVDSVRYHHKGRGAYSKELQFSYHIDGVKYNNLNRNTLFKAHYEKGDTLFISYSKFRPERSRVLKFKKAKSNLK